MIGSPLLHFSNRQTVMNLFSVSDAVTIGEAPSGDADIHHLSSTTFQSIFNIGLNAGDRAYSSRREGICARECGLSYLNHPIRDKNWDRDLIEAFRTKLELLPAPTYVHGQSPSKAAALCVVDRALREEWSVENALQFANKKNLPCCDDRWSRVIANALDEA